MAKIRDSDRASTATFQDSLPFVLKPGDRVGFKRDKVETGSVVKVVKSTVWDSTVWVKTEDGAIVPVPIDEILPPF